ncbi:FAD-binding oxidoreductase/lyase, partial [Falsiroseomonas oryzae]|uniref:hypothetical protein n=1 Tax=Falsiroseomonas oryzae TaxID=2766473 RepID=UPI0022EAFD33
LGRLPREGHVVAGRLVTETGCLDARGLDAATLARARDEVLARADTPDPGAAAPDLAARLAAMFGPTLLDAALRPACASLLGAAPEALAWNATQARLPVRIVIADRAETERMQAIGFLGARLAHPRAADAPGGSAPAYLYPRAGGIGAWVAAMETRLERAGVTVLTGTRIAALRCAGSRILGATLADGRDLGGDLVVLAAAPRALPLRGLPQVPEATMPVSARLLVVEGGAPTGLDWIVSYDPATPFLRLGFPDRLEGRSPGAPWRIVAELRESADDLAAALERLGLTGGGVLRAEVPLGTGRFAVETVAARAARDAALHALG